MILDKVIKDHYVCDKNNLFILKIVLYEKLASYPALSSLLSIAQWPPTRLCPALTALPGSPHKKIHFTII
jgi:hypothetical protein